MTSLDDEILIIKMAAALSRLGHGIRGQHIGMSLRIAIYLRAAPEDVMNIPSDRMSYFDMKAKVYAEAAGKVVRNGPA